MSPQIIWGLAQDEKGLTEVSTPGGRQQMAAVSEPGLYKPIQSSKTPGAKAFDHWVRRAVLPSIRKTGS